MNEFVLRTRITQFSTISEFAQNFQPDEQDCILTSRFLTNIFQIPQLICIPRMIAEDYGQGEPTDQMIDAMRRDLPASVRRLIAVGGGTILDIAKFLSLDYSGTLDDCLMGKVKYKRARDLIVIPTTCGTGSEVTHVAIAELVKRKMKKGLADDSLYPSQAVLIPQLIDSLPYKVFATSSIDALIHAVESFLSPQATVYSRLFSTAAIRLILLGYRQIEIDGKDSWPALAEDFLLASNYAGIAFGNAGCAAVHALSYPLGGAYHIPHGEANQLLFEAVCRKYEQCDPYGRLAELKQLLSEILQTPVKQSLQALYTLMNYVLKRRPLCEYGVRWDELESFADNVIAGQQRLLKNSCVPLNKADMMEIYQSIYNQ